MLTKAQKNKVRAELNAHRYEVYLFSFEEMDKLISNMKNIHTSKLKLQAWDRLKNKAQFTANYFSTGKDIVLLNTLLADFGFVAPRAYIKFYKGVPHIILKGRPGFRKIFTGTKYLLNNAKVAKMGLGKLGAIEDVKGGGILTIILVTAYRVLDYFLRDGATLSQLFGGLSTDIIKVGISTGLSMAAAAGTSVAGMAMVGSSSAGAAMLGGVIVAIGPLIAVIAVGALTAYTLDYLDNHYHITDHVIAALDELSEKGISGIIEEKKQNLMRSASRIANNAVNSVIDYIAKETEQIFFHFLRNLTNRIPMPSM